MLLDMLLILASFSSWDYFLFVVENSFCTFLWEFNSLGYNRKRFSLLYYITIFTKCTQSWLFEQMVTRSSHVAHVDVALHHRSPPLLTMVHWLPPRWWCVELLGDHLVEESWEFGGSTGSWSYATLVSAVQMNLLCPILLSNVTAPTVTILTLFYWHRTGEEGEHLALCL